MKYQKGDFVVVTKGDYSSYRILYVARALKDFDEKEIEATIPRHPPNKLGHKGRRKCGFQEWLCIGKFVEEIKYQELWDSDY